MIQFVGNRHHGNSLTGITEYLGSGYEHHPIVGIPRHCRLIRRRIRNRPVLPEIHAHVGHVFQSDDIIFRTHFADYPEFFLRQAHPGRVVRVRVDHRADFSVTEQRFQFLSESLATAVVNIEHAGRKSDDIGLDIMGREARIQVDDGVFPGNELRAFQKKVVAALH